MIREQGTGNVFYPGTPNTNRGYLIEDFSGFPGVEDYLQDRRWKEGQGILIIGPPGCGKTSLGFSILRAAWHVEEHRQKYWTEYDFLADVRYLWRMESMTEKLPRDDALWSEYLEWEKDFWDYKEIPHLFMDDLCMGYTPMQWYEVEKLLRERRERKLPTMHAVILSRWDAAPDSLQDAMWRSNVVVEMEARGDGRG